MKDNLNKRRHAFEAKLGIHIGIADLVTSESPHVLITVVGSCIAICLYNPIRHIGSLAHALLPSITVGSKKGILNPKRYVDTLIEMQIRDLRLKGIIHSSLEAKLIGGANMFSETIPDYTHHVGKKNVEKSLEILHKYKIPLIATDIGLTIGRRVEFYLETGLIKIFNAGGDFWKQI
ncbi:MAG: chemotaxis protein CheD [Candidatus Hodarchaeales archaeon]